jgi:DNA repair exonuclease SbcCD ATPase subunit
MFVWWNWLVEKDVGGLAVGALLLALAAAITKILRDAAEIRKLRAEARKIDADASAIRRRECMSDREGVRSCARNILGSVSALVDELYETFGLFAFPPAKIDRAKLRQAIVVAQRFRHEQRYRVEMEGLLAELATFARVESNRSLAELASQAQLLLTKVSDKKGLVARIEQAGLNADTTAAVRSWLGEVRELQIGLSTAVGTIVSQLALAPSDGAAR